MHLQPVVHVSPDGETAHVRSRLFVMFGILNANAQWGDGIYENVFVKQDGVWKLDYLHGYQTFYTNYEDGWAKKASAIFAPYDRLPPDRPQSVPYAPYPGRVRAAVPLPQPGVGPRRSLQGSDVAGHAAGRQRNERRRVGITAADLFELLQCRLAQKKRPLGGVTCVV